MTSVYIFSVPSFEATKYPITNGQFLEFVVAGGYTRRDLWSDEGWRWVQSRQARHPTFWICAHGFYVIAISSLLSFPNDCYKESLLMTVKLGCPQSVWVNMSTC